jgi:hypothetical protein
MKIDVIRPQCNPGVLESFSLEVRPKNDCVYEINCPHGHRFTANVLYHEFQKLFEVAIAALVDEYFREAIGSFTASYERFMELFIRIVMRANGIDDNIIDKSRKKVSSQSER